MTNAERNINDIKQVFWKKGACSHTSFYLLNRAFGHTKTHEEQASDPLAGGLLQTGHQCGMLWGTSLAAGAEAYRRCGNCSQSTGIAINATRKLIHSFQSRTSTPDCRKITGCNLRTPFGMIKLIAQTFIGGFNNAKCTVLMDQWIPEAIKTVDENVSKQNHTVSQSALSCASETVRLMGATDEEMALVAGFAGGLGISGNACGALAAATWMKLLAWCRQHPGKTPAYFNNPITKNVLKTFNDFTKSQLLCSVICDRQFTSVDDHTDFINTGGCKKLIEVLALS